MKYDKVIIGAGLYGLYSALLCAKNGENVLVLEYDEEPFKRASYINQARVHMGYHYPRSFSTATKSAGYFDNFVNDYKYCVNDSFDKIYATASNFSWTNADQFMKFCMDANIMCKELLPNDYFKDGMCDGAFLTKEFTYDAQVLKNKLMEKVRVSSNIDIKYKSRIDKITRLNDVYEITLENEIKYTTSFLLNATYASVNQILHKLGYEKFKIKYELCEIILCTVDELFQNVGITVMDGPFFSIMPFGQTGLHSLTSVTFTPHITSHNLLPTFKCQEESNGNCSPEQLGNCNDCPCKPKSSWNYMSNMATKFLKSEFGFKYHSSLFSMKPILKASEIDDSRPTVIKIYSKKPTFISVLSGKINTIYDLNEVLNDGV